MFKQFLPILTFVSCSLALVAQTPERLMGISNTTTLDTRSAPCTGAANAGTTTRNLGIRAKSKDVTFLCFRDSLFVSNTGSNLTEDPRPATQAGIGYIFYDCIPTIAGPRWSNVFGDACISKKPFNGQPPVQSYWLARGNALGRDTFYNDGSLQNGFNAGNPIRFFFAGATIYGFGLAIADIEGDTVCMGVDVANSFPVVYLNEVKITNITNITSRTGSFKIEGGKPQYDNSAYTFVIQKRSNPAIRGTVTTANALSGSTVNFTVPEDGLYDITATDGVSCDAISSITFTNAPVITLNVSNEQVAPGNNVCVKVTTNGFTNVTSFTFWLSYNSALLRYTGINRINLPGFDPANHVTLDPPSFVKDTIAFGGWININGATVPNGTLFEVCFQAIGPNGTMSPISFIEPQGQVITIEDPNGILFNKNLTGGSVKIGSSPVNVTLAADSVLCKSGLSGRIRLIQSAATGAPYTYTWRSTTNPLLTGTGNIAANATDTIKNLAAGTYSVTITNATNDVKTELIEVKEPAAALFLNPPTAINPCQGQTNGSLELTRFGGGTAPYTFRWSTTPAATTTKITNLAGGNYSATITDAKGCTAAIQASIGTVPIAVVTRTITPALCKQVQDGGITITSVSGGSPTGGNYTFKWSNNINQTGATSANLSLGAGQYKVTISDGTCEAQDSFVVPALRVITANATITNVACNGAATGSILVNSSGSSRVPYRFTWTGIPLANILTSPPTTSLASNLIAGTYPLAITDLDGCGVDTAFIITQPTALKIDSILQKNESCLIGGDGSVTVAVSGGTTPYTYRWSRSAADNQLTINNLVAGVYAFSVTDAAGCTSTKAFNVTIPQKPILELIDSSTLCAIETNGTGSLEVKATLPIGVTVTGYTWNNGGLLNKISNVKAGTYRVTVSLSNGCEKDTFGVVKAPLPITIDTANSSTQNPKCFGFKDGQIILVMKGGTPPYVYEWSGGLPSGNSVFSQLTAGTYQFTVTDFNKCQAVQTNIPLVAPPEILVAFSGVTGVSCYGKCVQDKSDGRAIATASGGSSNTGIYTYEWSSGETTASATQLCGSWQSVTVSDGTCFKKDSVEVLQPQPFVFQTPIVEEPSCFGLRDGKIEVVINGGTQPYAYNWSTGASSKDIINITKGVYSVVVTDSRNCTSPPLSITVAEPLPLIVDTIAEETRNVTCFNFSDGQIALRRVGGNGGRTNYTWSGTVSDSSVAKNLKAGIYYVTASDRKGCQDTIKIDIKQPDKIYYLLEPPKPPRCFGELTYVKLDTAFGSTFLYPFTISVDNGPQYPVGFQVPVFADDHLVTITEQITGCSDTFSISISQPPPISIRFDNILDSIPVPRILVGLGTDVRLNPNISSALPIDSVLWTPKDYLTLGTEPLRPTVRPLDDRTYKLKVIDVNGCIGEAEILVELERNRNVFVPNVFSPNSDDKNDYFSVFSGPGVKKINFVRVFDRWGELLYTAENLPPSSDPSTGWDGTFRGKPVGVGVYVFLVEAEFDDGAKLLYRGDVTVAR
jgi:gliding motility-associated-like protein